MRELTKVRAINEACQDAAFNRGPYVFADLDIMAGERYRIIRARTYKGRLQVRPLSTVLGHGLWIDARRVYAD